MADFFRGLAGGFQTGLQFSEARRRQQEFEELQAEREQLRQIYGAQPTMTPGVAATPAQMERAGLETGRLQMQDIADFGLTAQEAARYAPQMPAAGAMTTPTTYSFGGLTQQAPFSPEQLNRMRMQQAIPVITPRNPAEALRMQMTLGQEERARAAEARQAEMFPLQQQALQGQIAGQGLSRKQTQLQIDEAERVARERQQADEFTLQLNEARRQNPNMTAADMYRMASESGLNTDQQFRVLQNITGIDEALFKQRQRDIERMVSGKGLDALVNQFNKSDLIGPGRNYKVDRDPESGAVSLTLVDAATGNAVGGAQRFTSEGEATGYLARLARDPSTVADYTLNLETRRAQIKYYESQTNRNNAIANASRTYTPEQAQQLNDLSVRISDAQEAGDEAKAKRLTEEFSRLNVQFAGQIGRVIQPRPPAQVKPAPELSPVEMKKLESANRVIEERIKMGGAVTGVDRAGIYMTFGLDPARVGMAGVPGGGQWQQKPTETQPTAPRTSGLERKPIDEQIEELTKQKEARVAEEKQRKELRTAEEKQQVGLRRRAVQDLNLTVQDVMQRDENGRYIISRETLQNFRSSPYYQYLPDDVKRAMTRRVE